MSRPPIYEIIIQIKIHRSTLTPVGLQRNFPVKASWIGLISPSSMLDLFSYLAQSTVQGSSKLRYEDGGTFCVAVG